jgi:peptide/nickel transport system substrate-binding protein
LPKRGGTLVIGNQNDWVTMDPVFNTADSGPLDMIYGFWISWQKDPSTGVWGPHPEMVASWELQPNSLTLKLQPGIQFHDGTPWNANAAKWNLDRMIFDPASLMQGPLGGVDKSGEDPVELAKLKDTAGQTFDYSSKAVAVVDDMTVTFGLTGPQPAIIAALCKPSPWNNPISPTAYKKLGKTAYSHNPVGAGPYRFVEWQTGDHVLLERNPSYWKMGADGQPLPYLDRLNYRLFIDDSVRLQEMVTGDAQFTDLIQANDLNTVASNPNLSYIESDEQANTYRLIFDSTNANSPFYKSKLLRQAVLYALDRETMARLLGFGHGKALQYLLPRGDVGYDESSPSYAFDAARAQQAFNQAITAMPELVGSDGKIAFTLSSINREVDVKEAQLIKGMLDPIGFNTTIEILERAAWTAKLVKVPGKPGGSFDMSTMRNAPVPNDPDEQWRRYFDTTGGYNVAHLDDSKLDRMIDSAASTFDSGARTNAYKQLTQYTYDDPWYGYLWQQNWNWVFAKNLLNVAVQNFGYWKLSDVWLA